MFVLLFSILSFLSKEIFLKNLCENLRSFLPSSKHTYKKTVPCPPYFHYRHAHFLQLLKANYIKQISMFLACSIIITV